MGTKEDRIRWGILSTADIGVDEVIPALQQSKYGMVVAIASRSAHRAQQTAEALDIPTAYGTYEELLEDETIDAIYNPLPNHLHVPWTLKALDAGKHVLCEKPMAVSAEGARKIKERSLQHPHLKVMEAFMYRFHPQWQAIKRLLEDGSIGTLQTIHSVFTYFNDDADDIRNQTDMGGGGLLDIGCYCISLARFIYEQEPRRLVSRMTFNQNFGVDELCSGMMEFEAGTATFSCSTNIPRHQHATLAGTKGRIEIARPFNPLPQAAPSVTLFSESSKTEIPTNAADQYTLQGDAFARAILNDTPVPTSLEDALANMITLDAVFESAEKDQWISLHE